MGAASRGERESKEKKICLPSPPESILSFRIVDLFFSFIFFCFFRLFRQTLTIHTVSISTCLISSIPSATRPCFHPPPLRLATKTPFFLVVAFHLKIFWKKKEKEASGYNEPTIN